MTPDEAIQREWHHHYEDMRQQRDRAIEHLMSHVVELLELANEVFPRSTMPSTFQGNHSITLGEDKTWVLSIWYHDMCYPFSITTDERLIHTHEKRAFLESLRAQIDEARKAA